MAARSGSGNILITGGLGAIGFGLNNAFLGFNGSVDFSATTTITSRFVSVSFAGNGAFSVTADAVTGVIAQDLDSGSPALPTVPSFSAAEGGAPFAFAYFNGAGGFTAFASLRTYVSASFNGSGSVLAVWSDPSLTSVTAQSITSIAPSLPTKPAFGVSGGTNFAFARFSGAGSFRIGALAPVDFAVADVVISQPQAGLPSGFQNSGSIHQADARFNIVGSFKAEAGTPTQVAAQSLTSAPASLPTIPAFSVNQSGGIELASVVFNVASNWQLIADRPPTFFSNVGFVLAGGFSASARLRFAATSFYNGAGSFRGSVFQRHFVSVKYEADGNLRGFASLKHIVGNKATFAAAGSFSVVAGIRKFVTAQFAPVGSFRAIAAVTTPSKILTDARFALVGGFRISSPKLTQKGTAGFNLSGGFAGSAEVLGKNSMALVEDPDVFSALGFVRVPIEPPPEPPDRSVPRSTVNLIEVHRHEPPELRGKRAAVPSWVMDLTHDS